MKSLADVLGINDPLEPERVPAAPPAKMTAKALSREILQSEEYRQSLMRRIRLDELPPAVECKLMDYAWGKPVERVQVEDVTPGLESLSQEQLEARALAIVARARMRAEQRLPEEKPPIREDDAPTSVH